MRKERKERCSVQKSDEKERGEHGNWIFLFLRLLFVVVAMAHRSTVVGRQRTRQTIQTGVPCACSSIMCH